jgi:MFS family permease
MSPAETNIRLLNILTFLNGFRAYEGVLAVYFVIVTGSYSVGMTLFAVMHLSSSVFEVPTGVLSDNIGRKKSLILYYFSGTLAVLIFFLAESTSILMVGAIVTGFAMAMRSGVDSAFVHENLELLGKGESFKAVEGKRRALGRYALVIAGVLGTGVIYFYDIRSAILLTLIVLTFGFILSFFIKDIKKFEPHKANIFSDIKKAWEGFLNDPSLRDISLGRMIARGAGNSEYRFRSLFFAAIMPEWLVNLLGMLNNLLSGLAMHTAHWCVKKFGFMRSLVHIDIIDRVFVTISVLINTITSGIFMNLITSISFGLREVASEDLLQFRYSKDQRATMGSLVGLGGSLIYGGVAVTAGVLADYIGLLNTMLLMQPLLLLSSFFFYRGIKSGKH